MQGHGAGFSGDRKYRYLLWRTWDEARPHMLWVLLNPSAADEEKADQTLRRCIAFSEEWGYGGLEIVNLFALQTSDRQILKARESPIGAENDRCITEAAQRATRVVVGWGEDGSYRQRDSEVCKLLKQHAPQPLYCLGKNKDGSPRHPLYVPRSTDPIPYLCNVSGPENVQP